MMVCHEVSGSTSLAGWACPSNFISFNLVHCVNSFFLFVLLFSFLLSFRGFCCWRCFCSCCWWCCRSWCFFFLYWLFLGHYAAASSLGFSGGLLRFLIYSGSTILACATV